MPQKRPRRSPAFVSRSSRSPAAVSAAAKRLTRTSSDLAALEAEGHGIGASPAPATRRGSVIASTCPSVDSPTIRPFKCRQRTTGGVGTVTSKSGSSRGQGRSGDRRRAGTSGAPSPRASPRPARVACCSISCRRTIPCPAGWSFERGDVGKEDDVASAVARARAEFGRLDVAVANAGIVPPWHDTETVDLAEWDRVFAVNARGVMATIKHAVPLMKQQGGSIVAMGSTNSWIGHAKQARLHREQARGARHRAGGGAGCRPVRHSRQRALPRAGCDRGAPRPRPAAGGRRRRTGRGDSEALRRNGPRPHGNSWRMSWAPPSSSPATCRRASPASSSPSTPVPVPRRASKTTEEDTSVFDLTGKTILVTGASKGIGAAIVEVLGRQGANVVAHYGSDRAGAEAATASIPGIGCGWWRPTWPSPAAPEASGGTRWPGRSASTCS
mgnify:CR=1 FL=1